MISVFFGFLSLILVGGGVLCVSEGRSYPDEQRARAPRLWRAYVASGVPLAIVGVGSIAWLLTGGTPWAMSGIASVAAALPCFVQAWLHRTANIDRSPLAERLAGKLARTLNFPEATRRT